MSCPKKRVNIIIKLMMFCKTNYNCKTVITIDGVSIMAKNMVISWKAVSALLLRKPLGSHKETMTMTKRMTKTKTMTMTKMIMIS